MLLILSLNADVLRSQAFNDNQLNITTSIHFRFDKSDVDLKYMDNALSMQKFSETIDSIGITSIDSVVIVSQSSPEGSYMYNIRLSERRAKSMGKYFGENFPELQDRLFVHPGGESWGQLREYVEKDTLMKASTIEKIISIIDADIDIPSKKLQLEQMQIYRYLLRTYYPLIRNSVFCLIYHSAAERPLKLSTVQPVSMVRYIEIPESTIAYDGKSAPEVIDWYRKLYVKTNAVGLGLGIANLAVEMDVAKHWSVTIPVYYSAWNYFQSTTKFRTLAIQPEVRYWKREENDGLFAGAHCGLAYYNLAFDGDYRYQDHNGVTPAMGGGLSVGYRLPISKKSPFKVEFSIGAGVYSLHYDTFQNTTNVAEGQMIGSTRRTYCGIDQGAISFSYMFDFNKRGVKR